MTEPTREQVLLAAIYADWNLVAMHQGPPCFHIEKNGEFCLRALRWPGHDGMHTFVSLADLCALAYAAGAREKEEEFLSPGIINDAHILAGDPPHVVVEKYRAAIARRPA